MTTCAFWMAAIEACPGRLCQPCSTGAHPRSSPSFKNTSTCSQMSKKFSLSCSRLKIRLQLRLNPTKSKSRSRQISALKISLRWQNTSPSRSVSKTSALVKSMDFSMMNMTTCLVKNSDILNTIWPRSFHHSSTLAKSQFNRCRWDWQVKGFASQKSGTSFRQSITKAKFTFAEWAKTGSTAQSRLNGVEN